MIEYRAADFGYEYDPLFHTDFRLRKTQHRVRTSVSNKKLVAYSSSLGIVQDFSMLVLIQYLSVSTYIKMI